MKKTDVAMIILIASLSVLIAYFAGKALLGDAGQKSVNVKTTDAISQDVSEPTSRVFGDDSVNPTVKVTIGRDSNEESAF